MHCCNGEWTVVLYMGWGGNKEFEKAQEAVLRDIASAKLANIDVVYQFARKGETHWGRIRGETHEIVAKLPPIDIVKPHHLTRFLDWVDNSSRGCRRALFVKDHGIGTIDYDLRARSILHGSGLFQNDKGQFMPLPSFREAIEKSRVARFDVIGLDSCQNGSVEVAYELRNVTQCWVASESRVVSTGWPYSKFLPYLNRTDGLATARGLVEKVIEKSTKFTLVGLELAWMEEVAKWFDKLGNQLVATLRSNSFLVKTWVAQYFANVSVDGIAVSTLLTQLRGSGLCDPNDDALSPIEQALRSAQIGGTNSPPISVFFPQRVGSLGIATYGAAHFSRDTSWGEALSRLNHVLI